MVMPQDNLMTPPDAALPLPLYHKIYMVLHEQIVEGMFPADEPMPSEHELAAQFKVSRITIRRALDRLVQDGMIARQRGRGTFPTIKRTARPLKTNISGLLENLLAMGLNTKVSLLEFGYVQATDDVAEKLEIPRGAQVQKAVRVRRHDGKPMSFLTTYVPEAIGRTFDAQDMKTKPLLSLLEKSGVRVTAADQTITARLADARVAPHLEVEIGSPLLAVSRVVRDQQDRPVEYIRALYRPDLYEFQMSMSRKVGADAMLWEPDRA